MIGSNSSQYAASYMHVIFEENLSKKMPVEESLKQTFKQMHNEIEKKKFKDGTAAIMVYLKSDTLWLANAGESLAIVSQRNRPFPIYRDRRCDLSDEKRRIKSAGGFIDEEGLINGISPLSRSLGDCQQHPHVYWLPDILQIDVNNLFEYIIIASDGVWDFVSFEQAVNIVNTEVDPFVSSIKIKDFAYQLGSDDNISVIVIRFHHKVLNSFDITKK